METLIRFFCSKIIQVNFRNVLLMLYFYFKRVKNKWKIKKWINEKIISSTSFRWMFFRWRNVLQAHWIRLAACCSKRKHISVEIDNRVQKFTIIFIFSLHYLSSSNVSQSRYKFSPCALYNTRRPLLREKTYINFKKKIAQCIWKVVTRFLWNDGKENSNLWEKKVELEGFITQLLSLNKSAWICK